MFKIALTILLLSPVQVSAHSSLMVHGHESFLSSPLALLLVVWLVVLSVSAWRGLRAVIRI